MPAISFTPENLLQVLLLRKTETRRLIYEGDRGVLFKGELSLLLGAPSLVSLPANLHELTDATGRTKYQVGRSYAITPGRGKHAVGRVEVSKLTAEYLYQITQESVDRECFGATPEEYISRFHVLYRKTKEHPPWNPLLVAIRFKLVQVNERGIASIMAPPSNGTKDPDGWANWFRGVGVEVV